MRTMQVHSSLHIRQKVRKSGLFEFFLFSYIIVLSLVPLTFTLFTAFSLVVLVGILPLVLSKRNNKSSVPIFYLFSFILIWALITTTFHDYFLNMRYILFPIFYAFLAMSVPFIFSKIAANGRLDIKKHIFVFSAILTFCISIYALRIYAVAPGFVRLASPVGGSATIHVALLLTLSVYLANLKTGIRTFPSALLTFLTLTLIVLSGSRAGLLTMILLLLSVIINKRKPVRSIGTTILLSCMGLFLFKTLPVDRLTNLDNSLRVLSYQNSLNIATLSPENLFFGAGYGVIWPWFAYAQKVLHVDAELMNTPYGLLLGHPHSVFLGLFTELGLMGLVPFIAICFILIKRFFVSLRNKNQFNSVILYGVICTLPALMLDYYLFFNSTVSVIWWYFVFFAVSLNTIPKDTAYENDVLNQ